MWSPMLRLWMRGNDGPDASMIYHTYDAYKREEIPTNAVAGWRCASPQICPFHNASGLASLKKEFRIKTSASCIKCNKLMMIDNYRQETRREGKSREPRRSLYWGQKSLHSCWPRF